MFDSLIVCAAVTWAHYALLARARNHILTALISTVGLATLFTTSRILEYVNAHKRGIYGSCVFMTIRFHGFHVFVGTLVFFVIIILNHLMNTHYFGFKSAFWYWCFVNVVWLFLLGFIGGAVNKKLRRNVCNLNKTLLRYISR